MIVAKDIWILRNNISMEKNSFRSQAGGTHLVVSQGFASGRLNVLAWSIQ
jgi:hypothetical protein